MLTCRTARHPESIMLTPVEESSRRHAASFGTWLDSPLPFDNSVLGKTSQTIHQMNALDDLFSKRSDVIILQLCPVVLLLRELRR